MRSRALLALALAAVSLGACYRQVVDTGRPASTQVVTKPWQMSFIAGLVPPPAVDGARECPSGVARVETQHTILNQIVSFVTFGLVTPMTVTLTCAQGSGDDASEAVQAGSTPEATQAAINEAAARAAESGEAVLVRF